MITIKKIMLLLLIGSFVFILPGCGGAADPAVPDETAAETEPETEPETTDYLRVYGDLFKAKKALLAMTDLPFARSCYTAESLKDFENTAGAINGAAGDINEENIGPYINEMEQAVSSLELKSSGFPVVYITAGEEINGSYSPAAAAVLGKDGQTEVFDPDAEIRVRGNSTSGAPKKPFNIMFSRKQALLGMDPGKKWVLLANALDKTLMRNKLVFDFCAGLEMDFVPEAEYCEVWLNGTFLGSYLLTEAVTDGRDRVDIDTGKNEFLMELESDRTEENVTYIKSPSGVRLKIKKPDEMSGDQKQYLEKLLSDIESSLENGSDEELSQAVDLDSFADFYVFMELFKDIDAYFSSTFFYIKDDILYAGPPWDLDLISGNVSDAVDEVKYKTYCNTEGYGTGSSDSTEGIWMEFGWFKMLLGRESFRRKVIGRFEQLQPAIVNLYEDNEPGTNRIDALLTEYAGTFADNYASAGWSMTETYSPYERKPDGSFEENVGFLRSWLRARNEWLKNYFGISS